MTAGTVNLTSKIFSESLLTGYANSRSTNATSSAGLTGLGK